MLTAGKSFSNLSSFLYRITAGSTWKDRNGPALPHPLNKTTESSIEILLYVCWGPSSLMPKLRKLFTYILNVYFPFTKYCSSVNLFKEISLVEKCMKSKSDLDRYYFGVLSD